MNPLAFLLCITGLHQIAVMYSHQVDRNQKYELARVYADHVGKPLLVVGGPYGAAGFRRLMNLPAHGFGNVCIDLDPNACYGSAEYVQADVRDIPFPDKYFGAAFVSHVLEHLPTAQDCIGAVNELNRVAEVVLVASPTPSSIIASLIPGHWLWLYQEGDTLYIQQR